MNQFNDLLAQPETVTESWTTSVSRICRIDQNFTRIARSIRFSILRRSGENRNDRSGRASVAARRGYAPGAGEIWNVRGTMVELPAERNVLARHVIECP